MRQRLPVYPEQIHASRPLPSRLQSKVLCLLCFVPLREGMHGGWLHMSLCAFVRPPSVVTEWTGKIYGANAAPNFIRATGHIPRFELPCGEVGPRIRFLRSPQTLALDNIYLRPTISDKLWMEQKSVSVVKKISIYFLSKNKKKYFC